jgi:hypothetical protein
MKRQWESGSKIIGTLLASAALLVAQTSGLEYGQPAAPPSNSTFVSGQPATPPRPGTLNYMEGQVSINGVNVVPGATVLEPNQALSTSQGYAEVLLTPGVFLRAGHNSEVRLQTVGLVNTQVELIRGSAMIEAAQLVKGSNLAVTVNGTTTRIIDKGLYDFDTNQQSVRVLDGKAKIGETTLKKGDEIVLSSTTPLKKRNFDKKAAEADPLYVWSKVRSENESAANLDAANRVAVYGGWYGQGWYWDPFWSSYAFVPAWRFIGSPFGWGFYSPRVVYARPLHSGIARTHIVAGVHGGTGFRGGSHSR